MKESTIETYLINRVDDLGGYTRKVTYQGRKGAPDRWCFFPGRLLIIIELKRPGEKPDPLQDKEIADLRSMGQFVYWTDSKQGVDNILKEHFS